MGNNIDTNNKNNINNSQEVLETPLWNTASENWEKIAHKIKLFVSSLGLSLLSAGYGIYYSFDAIGKLSIVIFTWQFKNAAKTAGKALFCFLEVIYTPIAFTFSPGKVIHWHEKVFGVRFTLHEAELLRQKTIENYETKEKELNKDLGEKKIALEKSLEEINLLKTSIEELEKKQNTLTIQEENPELESYKKKLIEKIKEIDDLNETVENQKLEFESLNEKSLKLQNDLIEQQNLVKNQKSVNEELNDSKDIEEITLNNFISNLNIKIKDLENELEKREKLLDVARKDNESMVERIKTIKTNEIKFINERDMNLLESKAKLVQEIEKYKLLDNNYAMQGKKLKECLEKINVLQSIADEKKKVNNQNNIFEDENKINENKVNYSELLDKLDEKTTEEMFESYFLTNNNEIIDENENSLGSIIVYKDEEGDVNEQIEVTAVQKKAIYKAMETKKQLESDRTTFVQKEQSEITQDIKMSTEQLVNHEGKKARFKTNPILDKKENISVLYSSNFSEKDIKISILEGSQSLEKFDLLYQGYRLGVGVDTNNVNKKEKQASEFAESLEYIISEIIENDSKVSMETKKKLRENFSDLLNVIYQHITCGCGVNINKLSSKIFDKIMKNNPLELSIEQILDNFRTNLSIDDQGNFCIEQSAYIQLMLPVMADKIGTGLYSKSTVVTKISIEDPKNITMLGSYTNYLSEETHEIEENKIIKSQESYWSAFKGLVINTNASYKDEKYEHSLKSVVKGFKDKFDRGIKLKENLFRDDLKLDKKMPITLENLQTAYQKMQNPDSLNKLVGDILTLLCNEKLEIRNKYQTFVTLLRQALETEIYKSNLKRKSEGNSYDLAIDLLLNMSYYRLAGNNLYTYCKDLVELHIVKGLDPKAKVEDKQLDLDNYSLREQCEAIDAAPREMKGNAGVFLGKLKSATYDFDPHIKTNVPFVWGDIILGKKKRTWLRMASPTNQSYFSTNNNPEFVAFLEVLRIKKQKLLYINLQNEEVKWIENESVRVNKTRELMKTHSDVLDFFSFPYNSDLYYQRGKYDAEEVSYEKFKGWMKTAIKNNLEGYNFPQEVRKNEEFLKIIDTTLDDVHQLVFSGIERLKKEKREDFISIHNAFLAEFLLIWRDSDYFLCACKDAKDRAGQLNALILQVIGSMQGKQNEKKHKEMLRTFYNGAPIMVSKESIIPMNNRRKRAIGAYDQIVDIKVALNFKNNPERWKKYGVTEKSLLNYKN